MTDDALETMGARAASVRTQLGLTQQEFATRIGLSLSTLRKVEGDHAEPGARTLSAYAPLGANLHWVVTGEGKMWLAPDMAGKSTSIELTTAELDMVQIWRATNKNGREFIAAALKIAKTQITSALRSNQG